MLFAHIPSELFGWFLNFRLEKSFETSLPDVDSRLKRMYEVCVDSITNVLRTRGAIRLLLSHHSNGLRYSLLLAPTWVSNLAAKLCQSQGYMTGIC